jgi:GTPase SAR1 family protein
MSTLPTRSLTGFVMPVGNGAVGKTTVSRVLDSVSRFGIINEGMIQNVRKTNNLEFEYIVTNQTFGNTQYTVTLQFLVPPGQRESEGDPTGRSFEKVIEIYQSSIRRLDVVLFTYDLANHESFHDLVYWVDSVVKLMNDATHFILLGTHLDQINTMEITKEEINEGLEYLRKEILTERPTWMGKCTQLEVSCITGENLDVLLRYLAGSIIIGQQG